MMASFRTAVIKLHWAIFKINWFWVPLANLAIEICRYTHDQHKAKDFIRMRDDIAQEAKRSSELIDFIHHLEKTAKAMDLKIPRARLEYGSKEKSKS